MLSKIFKVFEFIYTYTLYIHHVHCIYSSCGKRWLFVAGWSWNKVEMLGTPRQSQRGLVPLWGPSSDVLPTQTTSASSFVFLFFLLCPFPSTSLNFSFFNPVSFLGRTLSVSSLTTSSAPFLPPLYHHFISSSSIIPSPYSLIMQRALSSRARATALSAAASKYRAGAGLGQQLRFAHKVCLLSLLDADSDAIVANQMLRSSSSVSRAVPLSLLVLTLSPRPLPLPSAPRVATS